MIYSPEIIMDDSVMFFKGIRPDIKSVLYEKTKRVIYPEKSNLLMEAVSALATCLQKTIDNQLSDF